MRLERFHLDESCVFSEDFSDLIFLRNRFSVSGNPTPVRTRVGLGMSLDGTDDKIVIGNIVGTIKTFVIFCQIASTTEQIVDFDSGTNYLSASAGTLAVASCADEVLYVNGSAGATITAGVWRSIGFTTATGITVSNLQIGTDNTDFGQIRIAYLIMATREWSAQEFANLHKGEAF